MKLNLLAVESLILFCIELMSVKEIISEIGTKKLESKTFKPSPPGQGLRTGTFNMFTSYNKTQEVKNCVPKHFRESGIIKKCEIS